MNTIIFIPLPPYSPSILGYRGQPTRAGGTSTVKRHRSLRPGWTPDGSRLLWRKGEPGLEQGWLSPVEVGVQPAWECSLSGTARYRRGFHPPVQPQM